MATPDLFVLGFADSSAIARRVAKMLRSGYGSAAVSTYRSGELKLTVPAIRARHVIVVSDVSEDPASLLRVLALAQGARDRGVKRLTLVSPWIAYGRQDRMTSKGEAALGLAIGRALSSAFDRIVTLDAHSPAFISAFGSALSNVLPDYADVRGRFDLVAAPDRGAEERAASAAKALHLPFIIVQKARRGYSVFATIPSADRKKIRPGMRVLLVDDIGDSGGTLIAAADAVRVAGAATIHAIVTHAINLTALRRASARQLASIRAFYDHATSRIPSAALDLLTAVLRK